MYVLSFETQLRFIPFLIPDVEYVHSPFAKCNHESYQIEFRKIEDEWYNLEVSIAYKGLKVYWWCDVRKRNIMNVSIICMKQIKRQCWISTLITPHYGPLVSFGTQMIKTIFERIDVTLTDNMSLLYRKYLLRTQQLCSIHTLNVIQKQFKIRKIMKAMNKKRTRIHYDKWVNHYYSPTNHTGYVSKLLQKYKT